MRLRVAGIDAGNERVDRVIEELVAEAATNERGDRFLRCRRPARDERLGGKPHLRSQRESACAEHRAWRGRQRHELSIAHDEARCRERRGFDALGARSRRLEQRIDERRAVERAVGSCLVEGAVAMDRAEGAAMLTKRCLELAGHLIARDKAPASIERGGRKAHAI